MGRNHLKGKAGDRFNVKMAAIGFNLRRVLAWLKDFLREIVTAIVTLFTNRQPIVR
jgi:IS5 family transposase